MVTTTMKSGLFLGFGSVLVLIGAILAAAWPSLFMTQLKKIMVVTNESMSYEMWREPPIQMYLECFLFNISNVNELISGKNKKIRVEQMGPYVFRETHTKTNITWNNENSTLTFFNERWWHFEPEMSNGSLSDMVTSVNPVVVTAAYVMRDYNIFYKLMVDSFMLIVHENLFLSANVSSWLFHGIDDPLLRMAEQFPFVPVVVPYDKFGWFYERNGSLIYDGAFNMNTGAADFSQLGNVEMWRYSNRTVYRDDCGIVRGSSGELWAPEYGQPEVFVFASDICTHLTLSKNKDVNIEGVDGVQYAANDSIFDNGHKYPQMECYCDEVRDANCMPSGALNVSACRYGAPAFVSLPHFLHSDPHYPSKIEGLNPTPDHNFRLTLEMFTGMPLEVFAQLQISLLVRHYSGFSMNNQLPDSDVLLPMFWFRQEVRITPPYVRMALTALRLRFWVPYGLYALTAIGILLLMPGVYFLMKRVRGSPQTEAILNTDATTTVTE
ncbi:scavenger receptor class B member 3 [Aphomia sociella]